MEKTFEVNNTVYVFDINAILEYINYSNGKEITEKEIVDDYEMANEPKLSNKTIKQVITPMDKDTDNLRYDFIKMFVGMIVSSEESYETMPFGIKMAFDSLVSIGLIKEYKIE